MHVLKQMGDGGHEQVVFVRDAGAGLTAIVAIHSTMLGPALGGTRMYPYATDWSVYGDANKVTPRNIPAGIHREAGIGGRWIEWCSWVEALRYAGRPQNSRP